MYLVPHNGRFMGRGFSLLLILKNKCGYILTKIQFRIIERDLISKWTKESLATKKALGMKLGRQKQT